MYDTTFWYALFVVIMIAVIGALIFYTIFSALSSKKGMQEKICNVFNAERKGDMIYFKHKGYDVIVTFKPDVKVNIVHNKDVMDMGNVKPPHGMKLTPLYLSFKIKKVEELTEKLNEAVEFIESIPTR